MGAWVNYYHIVAHSSLVVQNAIRYTIENSRYGINNDVLMSYVTLDLTEKHDHIFPGEIIFIVIN